MEKQYVLIKDKALVRSWSVPFTNPLLWPVFCRFLLPCRKMLP